MKRLDPLWDRVFKIGKELEELEKQEPRPSGEIIKKLRELRVTCDNMAEILDKETAKQRKKDKK